jgi:hypothetical protein
LPFRIVSYDGNSLFLADISLQDGYWFSYINHNRWLEIFCLEPEVIQAQDLVTFSLLFLLGFCSYRLISENSPNLLYMYTSGGTRKRVLDVLLERSRY